jgi:CRISPR/Cas system-associated exonuclease Cas4 (RecB family)
MGYHVGGTSGFPPLMNMAMDSILKARYDLYRKQNKFPPEAKQLLKDKVKVFRDLDKLTAWRTSASHLEVVNPKAGYILRGKIDDVFVEADGSLIPADYKSSGYKPKEGKSEYYKYQLAAYGFMFRHAGLAVSDRAYLLHYFITDSHGTVLDIPFSGHVDRVAIGGIDIEKMLRAIVKLLNAPYPGINPKCENCEFYKDVSKLIR